LAQNKNSLASQAAWGTLAGITSVIIGAGLTFGTGGAAAPIMGAQLAGLGMMTGGIISAGSAIAKPLATDADAKNLPVKVSGLVQADALNLVKGVTQIQAKFLTVKREYAEMIDSYFSAYGYTCNKVKVPNISARAIWNFTKTQGCCVVGNAPAMALKNIADIFDHRVRFWKDHDDIGNYSGNN
jgi:inorganic pyrophosphatase/exopolyphosphatase